MDCAELRLVNGDVCTVEGPIEEIEKALSDAARSGKSQLAWFTEHGAEGRVGVDPAHVVALRTSKP